MNDTPDHPVDVAAEPAPKKKGWFGWLRGGAGQDQEPAPESQEPPAPEPDIPPAAEALPQPEPQPLPEPVPEPPPVEIPPPEPDDFLGECPPNFFMDEGDRKTSWSGWLGGDTGQDQEPPAPEPVPDVPPPAEPSPEPEPQPLPPPEPGPDVPQPVHEPSPEPPPVEIPPPDLPPDGFPGEGPANPVMTEEEGKTSWFGWLRGRDTAPQTMPEPEPEPEPEPDQEPDQEPERSEEPEPPVPFAEPSPPAAPEVPPDEAPPPLPEALPESEAEAPPEPEPAPEPKTSWFARLKQGLSRSSSKLTQGIADLFTKRKLDDAAIEELEELLIAADLGVTTSARLAAGLGKARFNQEVSPEEVRGALAEEVAAILEPVARPLDIDLTARPHVVLVVGVNGSGKTTTIGKLARQFRDAGHSVTIAAGDTFRAAAVEQLRIWGDRSGCPVIARDTGADAAGLVYDALAETRARGDDILMIDTAGRLQNKTHLMAELQKIVRVLRKLDPAAPHTCLLVLDATVGQNAHSQVETFREMTDVNGLVLTKLDGTARGGVLVALAEKFALPVHYIGVGEQVDDLRPFTARDFARSLMGLQ